MLRKCIILGIDFYRNYISCLMLARCRFHPTCSSYARQAIIQKGLWQGVKMSFWRLLRCHPFNRASYFDPVE